MSEIGMNVKETEDSHTYLVPTYKVAPNGLESTSKNIAISFVRGSKVEGENKLPPLNGVVPEQLITLCIMHLNKVNDLVPSEYTSNALLQLENARMYLDMRIKDREERNVLNTYKK